ncbi:hypothetical protein NEOKW01_1798 [Nematocida sp. AWRm80]|nr:hypothetical protein NEOKW01_1798 [Nematocida sp. AWRm80]
MPTTIEDSVARAIMRLRKILECSGGEPKEIVEKLNKTILDETEVTLTSLLHALSALFKCESMYTTEKFIVLDAFYDLLTDLVEREEKIDLGDIPNALMKMKFLKNEKYVERAVVVYLNVILLMHRIVPTTEHRNNIFKVFCTLYMSKSFITSTRCGYLLPCMFKEFLSKHPEYVESLLENEDKLSICSPLLETVLSVYPRMNIVLSRLLFLDFIKRKSNFLVLLAQGKGFMDPFYFELYIERETAKIEDLSLIFCKQKILCYLVLDVSMRITSGNALNDVIEKMIDSNILCLIKHMKTIDTAEECEYCTLSMQIETATKQKIALEESLLEFNRSGDVQCVIEQIKRIYPKEPAVQTARYLRVHPETNLLVLGKYLGKEKNKEFLVSFCQSFNFLEMDLISALRVFLLSFNLPGEGQQIERIIYEFCKKYSEDRKQHFDTVLSISMAVIILNTSIHNVNTVKKISIEDFTSIILAECPNVDLEYLEALYMQIKHQKLHVPQSNVSSLDNIDLLATQSDADIHLRRVPQTAATNRYCRKCALNVYTYILNAFKLKDKIITCPKPKAVQEFVKVCMDINLRSAAYETIAQCQNPTIVTKLVYLYKRDIHCLWSPFINALEELCQQKEGSSGGSKFFRSIFLFGKDTKKDKKESMYSESDLNEIIEETKQLSNEHLTEMAIVLLKRLETEKKTILFRVAFLLIQKNLFRIKVLLPLLELAISSSGFNTNEILTVCANAPFSEIFSALSDMYYKPSKHTTMVTIALLNHISTTFTEKTPTESDMVIAKNWLLTLTTAEAFKYKNQEIVMSLWDTIEVLAVKIDTMGYDLFEVFIKLRETLKLSSKLAIISNTQMYYKNINRILLCLDILQTTNDQQIEERLLHTLGIVIDKDIEGIAAILDSCENILEKTSIYSRIENMLYDKLQTVTDIQAGYLQKLATKMSTKKESVQEIVDL